MNKRGRPDYNRNIKLCCPRCGYVARTTRKWLEAMGPAHCPVHGVMAVEGPVHGLPVVLPDEGARSAGYVGAALRLMALLGCDGLFAGCDSGHEDGDGACGAA